MCPIHGEWNQKPMDHLAGCGCPQCSKSQRGASKTKTGYTKFIQDAQLQHNNKFSYDASSFVNMTTPMKIICPCHGEFEQVPDVHRRSMYACPTCLSDYQKLRWVKFRADK